MLIMLSLKISGASFGLSNTLASPFAFSVWCIIEIDGKNAIKEGMFIRNALT